MGHERTAKSHHLLLPTRQGASGLPAALFEDGKQVIHLGQCLLAQRPRKGAVATHVQVFFHRHPAKQQTTFRDDRNVQVAHLGGVELGDVLAAQQQLARTHRQQPHGGVDQGGLARSVGAHDGHQFTLIDVKVNVPQCWRVAIRHIQTVGAEQCLFINHGASPNKH